jgi:hypothetical protein
MWKRKFKAEKILKGCFSFFSTANSRGWLSAVEETIPPYPIIPHFFALQRNKADSGYQLPAYKLFERP